MYQRNNLLMIDDDPYTDMTNPARRWALDKGEIFVEYQPMLSQRSNNSWEMSHVEALPRWRHPKRGVLLPAAFTPALEKSGLIAPLSDFVLAESVRQLEAWQLHGFNISVAVNLPSALLDDPAFPDRLIALLDSHHLDYAKLVLEISEGCVMHSSVAVTENLRRLRDKGFGLAIDGFGTGYASLSQLYARLACNALKIDASLVHNIKDSNTARAAIQAIIFLGHKLGINVCADGIETEYAFSFLADAGCDKLQGSLISPAISAVKLQKLAQEWCNSDRVGACGEGLVNDLATIELLNTTIERGLLPD